MTEGKVQKKRYNFIVLTKATSHARQDLQQIKNFKAINHVHINIQLNF